MKWSQLPYKHRKALTNAVIARDGWLCYICKRRITSRKQLSVEHIIKQRDGGSHELSNLAPAHKSCNYSDSHDFTKNKTTNDNTVLFF